jgi:translation initiation factor IF-2
MISKQKRNLINELSFYIIEEIKRINENNFLTPNYRKDNIRKEINIIKSSKNYTNKQIKELIKELKYQLPF